MSDPRDDLAALIHAQALIHDGFFSDPGFIPLEAWPTIADAIIAAGWVRCSPRQRASGFSNNNGPWGDALRRLRQGVDPMTTRDELADLVREQITHDTSDRWTMNLVDAILARWRLVPVEEDEPEPTGPRRHGYHGFNGQEPCQRCMDDQHRAADELTRHDQTAGHYDGTDQ